MSLAPLGKRAAVVAAATSLVLGAFTPSVACASYTFADIADTSVPEPTTGGVMVMGLSTIAMSRRRNRRTT